jgi:deazaflavin-dependent oxidoreductase (nitroreductase family)
MVDLGFRSLNLVHRTIVHVTGARLGGVAFGMPIIELHTLGRESGRERSVMLTSPVTDGRRYVLVASKGGDDRNPDWFENLRANPEVEMTIGTQRRPMRARIASEEEEAELWPQVVTSYKPYSSYRRRAQRHIPLVICEPR